MRSNRIKIFLPDFFEKIVVGIFFFPFLWRGGGDQTTSVTSRGHGLPPVTPSSSTSRAQQTP